MAPFQYKAVEHVLVGAVEGFEKPREQEERQRQSLEELPRGDITKPKFKGRR